MQRGDESRRTVRASAAVSILAAMALAGCGPSEDAAPQADPAEQQALRAAAEPFAGRSAEDLVSDPAAMQLAGRLFGTHCAGCHAADGRGKQGVTDLVDGVFNYGNSFGAVRETIALGRRSIMPAMGNQFGEMNLGQLVAYVESLASDEPLGRLAVQGKQLFDQSCAECHGPDGRGNLELGGPNLADDYWLHGDTMMAIRLVITRGAEGTCPPHARTLSAEEIELLAAYVVKLNERPTIDPAEQSL